MGRRPRCRRALLAPMLLLVASGAAADRAGAPAGRDMAGEARSLAERARSGDARDPTWLRTSADRIGELVAAARASQADVPLWRALAEAGAALSERTESVRRQREAEAGADEAALEALLRSADWQSLRYAAATLTYWDAWSRLELAGRLPPGSAERRALAEQAVSAFGRATRSLVVPGLAAASLLGLGVARLETGDLEAAGTVLEHLQARIERGEASEALRVPLLRALVQLQLRRGDPERAAQTASRIPAGGLSTRESEQLRSLGSLLAAERALASERYAEARDLYARVLEPPAPDVGLDLRAARYGYAIALHETGGLEQAAQQLDRVLSDPPSEAVARDAASRRYAIAERLLQQRDTPGHRALAASARGQLLEHAPDAPAADMARVQLARESETAHRPEQGLAELERIDPGSPAYPTALWDRIRLRAALLESRAARNRAPDPDEARRLARDIDAARRLGDEGRLSLDASALATLAVLRARSAYASGAGHGEVMEWVERARSEPGLDADERRALLVIELRVLEDARDFAGFASLLAARDDARTRRDFALLYATARRLEERGAPAALRVEAYTALAPAAPPAERPELELDLARALLDRGDAGAAARRARSLVDADGAWGDARWVYARALDVDGDAREAASAWRDLVRGVETGSPRWQDATLGLLRALRRAHDLQGACEAARGIADRPALDDDLRAAVGEALAGCSDGVQGAGKP